ncbi:hypothetical protein BV22DRAFT_1195750 [Leucogyrophana mollusca]|uniref:Uncharacterized protein n=1 Tax=Leucogyrophana mollusca TaxID=85980 RepID=A0ACB8BH89_9AGAM|nr:hypothetical protein BV22DRAFT_1195750 [Leucogyrophana mollusca]
MLSMTTRTDNANVGESLVTFFSNFFDRLRNNSFDDDDFPPPNSVSLEDAEAAIDAVVGRVLRDAPFHLFHTIKEKLYSESELVSTFRGSSDYKCLLGLQTRQETILTSVIEATVTRYFQYAMLSHKWEDDEPLYEHVSSTPQLPRKPGDKTNSTELQRSISSMFSWYRNSAITVVYLSDVTTRSLDALMQSAWFYRGWTLQELLAPRVIRFYKKDWTPYTEGSVANDKEVEGMLQSLEAVTGVDRESLTRFTPGRGNARQKMAWASKRKTKWKEDMAYCLMGIFDVSIAVQYGDSEKDLVFGRLMAAIFGHPDSGDLSPADWVGPQSKFNSGLPAHPSCFLGAQWRLPAGILWGMQQPLKPQSLELSLRSKPVTTELLRRAHAHIAQMQSDFEKSLEPQLGANSKLMISCTRYAVGSVTLLRHDQVGGRYHHRILAGGLYEFEIHTTGQLDRVSDQPCPYMVARIWGGSDLGFMRTPKNWVLDKLHTEELVPRATHKLFEPFVAILLVQTSDRAAGPYRRIPTIGPIVARATKLDILQTPTVSALDVF